VGAADLELTLDEEVAVASAWLSSRGRLLLLLLLLLAVVSVSMLVLFDVEEVRFRLLRGRRERRSGRSLDEAELTEEEETF